MKQLAAAVALVLAAAPLAAQRMSGPGRGGINRAPIPGAAYPRPGFINPDAVERRPVVPSSIGPIAFPSQKRQWLRVDTSHFLVISGVNENTTRDIAHDLEKLRALLTRTSRFFQAHPMKTRVFLFGDRRVAQTYFNAVRGGQVDASGMTLRHFKGSTILIDGTARGGGALTPRHELVHDLLHRAEKPLPLWIEEGLAEYYSNAGLPIREHASRVRGRTRIPTEQILAATAEDPRAWTYDFYAQSWAAVTTLMRRDRVAFFAFLEDVDRGMTQIEALRKHYDLSPRDLEVAMRKSGAPATPVLLDHIAVPLELVEMKYADVLSELGEILARVPGREGEAERHFRAALDADPNSDVTRIRYAEVLATMPKRAVDARVQAQSVLDHDPDHPRANGVIGLSYFAEKNALAARPYLDRSTSADPSGIDVAYALFQVDLDRANALAREGKLLEAARVLRDLAPKMPERTRVSLESQAVRLETLATP